MPIFGAHLSIAGGHYKAAEAAAELGMDALQIFTSSPSQWASKPISEGEAKVFTNSITAAKLKYVVVHDSYLINLAAPDEALFQKSITAFTHEIERTAQLGIPHLVMHPGAHVGSGDEAGLKRVIDGLNECRKRSAGLKVKVLIETTAGQGTTLGWKFEHIATILDHVENPDAYGVCVDTCHIFAAGYPLGTKQEYDDTFDHFDELIGIDRICAFHLNDSVKGVGCRVDRHAGIGFGKIGDEPFQRLVNDKRFKKLPMILETPKEVEGVQMDPINLAKLRGFIAKR